MAWKFNPFSGKFDYYETAGVSSFNTRTGAVTLLSADVTGALGYIPESAISAGSTLQYWRGDKTWQTLNTSVVPEGSNLYYTNARARAALSGTTNQVNYNSSTGVFSLPQNIHTGATPQFSTLGLGVVPSGAILDSLFPIDGVTAGIRLRQSNVPDVRWWDIFLANNAGAPALQYRTTTFSTTYNMLFMSYAGQVGLGDWASLDSTIVAQLDAFTIIAPLGSGYTGITLTDASTPRLMLRMTTSSSPATGLNAVQLLHMGSNGDLGLAARGTAATNVIFYTANGTNPLAERMRVDPNGRVGIGTNSPNASAILDLSSTTKGFLPPRMTATQIGAISSPAEGLIVYDTTNHGWLGFDGSDWVSFQVA